MAVFTKVGIEDLHHWLPQFDIGSPQALQGISSGIENSNFFLTTDRGEFVLTLFEKLTAEQLPFYLQLMRHLAQRNIPVPAPVPATDGALFRLLNGKPAAIVSKLTGASNMHPEPLHCAEVGAMLARMHLAGRDFQMVQPNLRGLNWWQHTTPEVLPHLDEGQAALLRDELADQTAFAATACYRALPTGPGHCDLFRNNVMFDGDRLSGFFDFYFAGNDTWLFDLAVTVNDWCIDPASGALDPIRTTSLMTAYSRERSLSDEEQEAWPIMLRAAALRFWLSRLRDYFLPREADMLTAHDPTHFERILLQRRAFSAPLLTT